MTANAPVKFLLVDDIDSNLEAMAALLARDGVEIHCADCGRAALELLLLHDFALALLDVQMPEMDGYELAEIMRATERTRRVPIIFITGREADPMRQFKGYEAGAVDFLVKPVDPTILRSKASIFFDLARQRQELEELAARHQQTLLLNETFVAAVTHDLRTPLSSVLMGAELLDARVTDANARRALSAVRASALRMGRMIDELTDLARARLSGGMPVEPRDMDAHDIGRSIVDEAATAYPERDLQLHVTGDTAVRWDRDRMARALANLVSNGLQHGAADRPVVTRVDGSHPERVRISVWNGGTILPSRRARLFDPFVRAHDGHREGLGLGLYIVRHIVMAHGGRVEVRDEDEGTAFDLDLPRRIHIEPEPGAGPEG